MSKVDAISSVVFLDMLCPMHVVLNATGHIVRSGSTLTKLLPEGDPSGIRFLELFELKRPRIGEGMEALRGAAGRKLHLQLRDAPRTEMKGVLAPLPEGSVLGPTGGAVVNLSFGISILEAVRDFNLTDADFAATDLAIEMLYLVEAKSAAMEASRKLNLRLQGAKIAAEEQAYTDTLTGLKNRRALDLVLARLEDTETDFTLMNCDLDFFKAVNDTMGHAAGDFVLQRVAQIMTDETREDDTIVRVGGDEFVLIFPHLTKASRVGEIATRLITRLEEPIMFNEQACRISASIGTTMSSVYQVPTADRMMEDADIALYAAKNAGRGQHKMYDASMRSA